MCIFVMSSNSKASIKTDCYIFSFYLLLQRWAFLIVIRPYENCKTKKTGIFDSFLVLFYRNIRSFNNFFISFCKKLISSSPFWGFLLLFAALPSLEILLWKSVMFLLPLLLLLVFWLWVNTADANVLAVPTVLVWVNVLTFCAK